MTTSIPPAMLNVLVIVELVEGAAPNVTCDPALLPVYAANTILNYQLVPPSPDSVRFTGYSVKSACPVPQLSAPSISLDGQLMTFVDANTRTADFSLTLEFSLGERTFTHDPQVVNRPTGA